MSVSRRGRRFGAPLLAALLLGFAFWALRRELAGTSLAALSAEFAVLHPGTVLLAVALTALNYATLTGYDLLAVRYAGVRLAPWRVSLAAVVGYSFSQSLGFPLLTGTPVRYRLYSAWGVEGTAVARVIAFYATTVAVGAAAVAGITLLLAPVSISDLVHLPWPARSLGMALLLALALYAVWALRGKGELRVGPVRLDVPEPREVGQQIVLGGLDWVTAAAVLWVLLPEAHGVGFAAFLSVYVVAQIVGMMSQVPAGLGVFEAMFLVLIPGPVDQSAFLASVLAFRAVYYVLPLLVGFVLLSCYELYAQRRTLIPGVMVASRWATGLVPYAAAAVAFVLGAMLLLSGSVPIASGRLATIGSLLPLALLEVSHFLGSVVGVALLILARGLLRRLDGAYHVTLWLLLAAVLLSLTRGLELAGTITLAVAALLLYGSRRQFYRPASLLDEPFTVGWMIAIGSVFVAMWWLGTFAYQNIDYSSDVWWRFALAGDAPRFLRATVGVLVTLVGFIGLRLLHHAPPPIGPPSPELLERVAPLVAACPQVDTNLVFLGDKQILLSPSERSFLMFAVSGSSWVVLGDPIGDEAEFPDLLWTFREQVDIGGGRMVLYKVKPALLPLYIDLGLTFHKLGEEGLVPLVDFSLAGGRKADFRKALSALERGGGSFRVLSPEDAAPLLPTLREISDGWLEAKKAREKRFSLGRFDESYLARFPMAVVAIEGRPIAFANVWANQPRHQVSVDVMRYADDAPRYVMDALFGHLLLWASSEGYEFFSLGLAPLSGMETHRLAPVWQRFGHLVFRYGENFYNFQGLRDFKEKFDPVWEPRYLAAPPAMRLPGTLADVTALIAGGFRGVVAR